MVKTKCLVALEVFIENLGDDAKPYIAPLMQRLFGFMQSKDSKMQVCAVKAMRSAALASPEHFRPFADNILPMMATVMQQDGPEEIYPLRGAATECVGAVAISVGKDVFSQRWLQGFLPLAIKGMNLDDFELRESTYNFFASIARLLGADFQPLMKTVLTFALASCVSDDGLMYHKDESGGKAPEWVYDDDSDEDEELAALQVQRNTHVSIYSGALDEKMAAMRCIGAVLDSSGSAFFPYLQKTLEVMEAMADYSHHYIRSHAVTALHEVLCLIAKTFPSKVQPGNPNFNPKAKAVVDQVIPVLIFRLVEEDEKEVCASAAEALKDAFNMFGIGCAGDKMEWILEGVKAIIEQKAPCQPDECDLDEQEIADHDEVLMDHVTDLITALAKAAGPNFDEPFQVFFPPLQKFCSPEHPPYDRSMSIGCFGEVAEYLGPNLFKYIPHVVPYLLIGLQDKAIAIRRNSAYCTGTFFQHGKSHMVQYYAQLLPLLTPLLNIGEKPDHDPLVACADNAASAISKLIMTAPQQIPLAQLIPVFLSGLPLRGDMDETKYVYTCLLGLFRSHQELMAPHIPQVVNILSRVLGSPVEHVSAELQTHLQGLAKTIAQQMGEGFVKLLQSIPQPYQERLTAYLR